MSTQRGVVANWQATGSRPVSVNANEPLALVLTSNEVSQNEMLYFDSLQKGLEHFFGGRTEQQIKAAIAAGTIKGNLFRYLVWATNKYDLRVPLVVSVAKHSTTASTKKTNVINAINDVKKAPSKFKIRPDVIGVADFTSDRDIANAVISACDYLRARSFIDLEASNGSDAVTKRDQYGSERVTPLYTNLMDWDTLSDSSAAFSAAFAMALLRTYIDGSDPVREVGWSFSISNKVVPVSDTVNETEFLLGLGDETDNLTSHQITSFIEFMGVRVWNYQTCSADPLLQDARRVRIFDKLTFAVLPAIFPFIDSDRGVAAVKEAKDTIRDFVADMIGKEVLLGGFIELDTDLTTSTAITQGKFYIKVRTQENPVPVRIAIEFNRESIFNDVVYKKIG